MKKYTEEERKTILKYADNCEQEVLRLMTRVFNENTARYTSVFKSGTPKEKEIFIKDFFKSASSLYSEYKQAINMDNKL